MWQHQPMRSAASVQPPTAPGGGIKQALHATRMLRTHAHADNPAYPCAQVSTHCRFLDTCWPYVKAKPGRALAGLMPAPPALALPQPDHNPVKALPEPYQARRAPQVGQVRLHVVPVGVGQEARQVPAAARIVQRALPVQHLRCKQSASHTRMPLHGPSRRTRRTASAPRAAPALQAEFITCLHASFRAACQHVESLARPGSAPGPLAAQSVQRALGQSGTEHLGSRAKWCSTSSQLFLHA